MLLLRFGLQKLKYFQKLTSGIITVIHSLYIRVAFALIRTHSLSIVQMIFHDINSKSKVVFLCSKYPHWQQRTFYFFPLLYAGIQIKLQQKPTKRHNFTFLTFTMVCILIHQSNFTFGRQRVNKNQHGGKTIVSIVVVVCNRFFHA